MYKDYTSVINPASNKATIFSSILLLVNKDKDFLHPSSFYKSNVLFVDPAYLLFVLMRKQTVRQTSIRPTTTK